MQAETVMDTLIENTAQEPVALDQYHVAATGLAGRDGRRQAGGTAADHGDAAVSFPDHRSSPPPSAQPENMADAAL